MLCTHALLQDMNGNNISIQKTNTDVINIYATVYLHFNQAGDIHIYDVSESNNPYQPANLLWRILAGRALKFNDGDFWSESYSTPYLCAGKNFVFDGSDAHISIDHHGPNHDLEYGR